MQKIISEGIGNKFCAGSIFRILMLILLGIMLQGCGQGEELTLAASGGESAEEAEPLEPEASEQEEPAKEEPQEWYVYVTGAVEHPGVYRVSPGDRVFDALKQAGGMREDASLTCVNQAAFLTDGEMLRILTEEEAEASPQELAKPDAAADGLIDLNRADLALLMTLPGIGEAKAKRILEFRETRGGFQSIEELREVEGIGNATFERLKELIRV